MSRSRSRRRRGLARPSKDARPDMDVIKSARQQKKKLAEKRTRKRASARNKYAREAAESRAAFQRLKMCESKKPYNTQLEADSAAEFYRQRPYQCPHCGLWHLTSKT